MPFRAPFACFLGALSALLIGVTLYQGSHAKGDVSSLSLAELSLIRAFYARDVQVHEDMSRFDGVLLARCEERRVICDQVAAGRMSLFEAAAQFKHLNSLPGPSSYDAVAAMPGDSENERVCSQVISWLESTTRQLPPSQREAVVERAKADLREHRDCHGTVILPGD
jgi:hypothetical protein